MDISQQDALAVEAVRRGDPERYRELVERHERVVYAIAWARLGDTTLAEEAAQEAFIRAYRCLAWLGNGAKFAAWVSAITRRVAINLGLRHRREMKKRERWALEQTSAAQTPPGDDAEEICTPETLRQTLAELPPAHRECLVLFHLEGRSGAEAAAALGISEAALRVRLHRARAALREKLEERLADSLGKLRPAKSVAVAVMATVLASSSAKAATVGGVATVGAGAKLLASVCKTFPFFALLPLVQVIACLPSMAVMSWIGRVERRNYREPEGFRSQLHRRFFRSYVWGFPVVMLLILTPIYLAKAVWGISGMYLWTVSFLLIITVISARSLKIQRNLYQVGMFGYCCIILAGLAALAAGWLPPTMSFLPMIVATALFAALLHRRPTRMDYSLFLRASQGLFKPSRSSDDKPQDAAHDRSALLAFARFLGSLWLVTDYRWERSGLTLRLPPVRTRYLVNMAGVFLPMKRRGSHLLLRWDGKVVANCSDKDAAALATMKPDASDPAQLESLVTTATEHAWREFRNGNAAGAERALGELSESDVFVVPPHQSKATRGWRWVLIGCAVVMLGLFAADFFLPERMSGLKPVSLTEAKVRAFLSTVTTNPNPVINGTQRSHPSSPSTALFDCLVLPSTNLFSEGALRAMRDGVAEGQGLEALKNNDGRAQWVFNAPLARYAVAGGWISWSDLGIQPAESAAFLRTNRFPMYSREKWDRLLTLCQAWSLVNEESVSVRRRITSDGLTQLRLLREVDCLDLVDRDRLIQQIASAQVLSARRPGQPPIHNWKSINGLFHAPGWPTLQDTYFSVAALEILGGLDRIDREACIRGILRRHRSKGFFTSPEPGGYNEYKISGDARDTLCAFETLRILGALDRVKDLEKWKFRPQRRGVAKGQLTWRDVEAWVCAEQFARFLRERRENPQSSARSLLEP